MPRYDALRRLVIAACAGCAFSLAASHAAASNPLEYPDNGAAAFSRGGAWLATASDPIAAHYNPAAMVTQSNGFSLDLLLAYNSVCYLRKNPGNQDTGPLQRDATALPPGASRYIPVCNETSVQPRIIPSLAIVWRAAEDLAFGFAVVPPATYGSTPGEWPTITDGKAGDQTTRVPAPYRYMTVGARATILHPTLSFGYELAKGFRVGAGFIWSVAVIDTESFSAQTVTPSQLGDNAGVDAKGRLRTQDLFVPGAVLALHWSLTENFDAAVWGRWIDAIDASEGRTDVLGGYYDGPSGYSKPAPVCQDPSGANCANQSIQNRFEGNDFKRFRYVATPPEVRAGIRFHLPRTKTLNVEPLPTTDRTVRDPLHDDIFDVELDGSYTMNSVADTITIRFRGRPDGGADVPVKPSGNLPPRADRPTGYKDSFGVRLGGQYNIVPAKFGIRAGTWFETAAADAEWLHIAPVPAARGGFGGGVVYRHGDMDFSVGYQRHYSLGLDNGGNGKLKAGAGVDQSNPFRIGQEPDEQQFRTYHIVNGGRVEQSANVFTVGAVYRF